MLALERPPRWGVVAIVALVLANICLVVLLVQRGSASPPPSSSPPASTSGTPAPTTAGAPGSSTPSASASASADPSDDGESPLLAVYGDGYSSGNSSGGVGAAGWPALVAQQLDMRLQLTAATLAGYVRPGSTAQTYPQLVQTQPPAGAAVTVVFGSRNDQGASPAEVQAAASATFQAVLAAAPGTNLVVIGPSWSSADVPAELAAVSAAVRTAAEGAGAAYVDPVAAGWFADPAGLVSPVDGISILDPGHAYLAGLIAPVVQAELRA